MKTRLLQSILQRTAARLPDRLVLVDGQRRISYAALTEQSLAFAGFLQREAGLGRGDRVVVHLENCAEVAMSVFGSLEADGVFSVLNPGVKQEKLRFILNHCAARVLIGSSARRALYETVAAAVPSLATIILVGDERAPPGRAGAVGGGGPTDEKGAALEARFVRWDVALTSGAPSPASRNIDIDLAALIYTSGSTGDPKGVMLTHANLRNTTWAISTYLENTKDDVIFSTLPLSFDYGLYQILTTVRVGARAVIEKSFGYPYSMLKRMLEEEATGLPGVPTIFAILLSLGELPPAELPRLRYLTNTAAVLPPDHIRRLRQIFPAATLYSMYGLTECTRVSYLPPGELDRRPESVGRGMPNEEVWVQTEGGRVAAPGEVGELVIRGSNVMRGYWADPEATAACLKPGPNPGELVLYSGDLFKTDEDGFLYFVGRKDDIIKCRGEKVSPREIENVLHSHPAVSETAVIGVAHAILGQAVKAFVVLRERDGVTPAELVAYCRSRLEDYMVPKEITIVETLPRTDTGKVRKRALQ